MLALLACALLAAALAAPSMPAPFARPLGPGDSGQDVYILQNLLQRVQPFFVSLTFDGPTGKALQSFQGTAGLPANGMLDAATAAAVLEQLSADGWRWDGSPAGKLGYKYLIHIRTFYNRSIESTGTLYDAQGVSMLNFTARLRGKNADDVEKWCTYGNGSPGLNMFSDGGSTPSGLAEIDLNTPESNATEFGPYPVNRLVQGLAGNAAWLIVNNATTMVRDGILVHTGDWAHGCAWKEPNPMPDSLGCVHVWPENIDAIQQILQQKLGVTARPNTDGALPYPYKPQGLIAIEEY